jgi:hypothetical protein
MSKQNSHQESRQSVTAKNATSLAPTKKCYLVCGDYTQPSKDENDSRQEEFHTFHLLSAKSKSDATKQMVRRLKADGFRKVEEDEAEFDDEVPKWTNEWAVVELEAFVADDADFWDFFTWEPSLLKGGLVDWAKADPVSALSLAQAAFAGDSDGHKAIANHAGFIAVVQKHELEASLPADSTFGKPESKRI